jgi:hypothetical protein
MTPHIISNRRARVKNLTLVLAGFPERQIPFTPDAYDKRKAFFSRITNFQLLGARPDANQSDNS